jgi:hypothetical protein
VKMKRKQGGIERLEYRVNAKTSLIKSCPNRQ